MMAKLSDNSNQNGGDVVGMGGVDRIFSNLISRVLLVSGTLFLFWVSFFGERAWC